MLWQQLCPGVPNKLLLILDFRPGSGRMWIRQETTDILIKKKNKKLRPQSISLISDTNKQTGSFIFTPAIISPEAGSLLQLYTPVLTQISELEEDRVVWLKAPEQQLDTFIDCSQLKCGLTGVQMCSRLTDCCFSAQSLDIGSVLMIIFKTTVHF